MSFLITDIDSAKEFMVNLEGIHANLLADKVKWNDLLQREQEYMAPNVINEIKLISRAIDKVLNVTLKLLRARIEFNMSKQGRDQIHDQVAINKIWDNEVYPQLMDIYCGFQKLKKAQENDWTLTPAQESIVEEFFHAQILCNPGQFVTRLYNPDLETYPLSEEE